MSMDIRVGDCREVMAGMGPASVDAIVCDPPYGLAFMGKAWDHGVPGVPFWAEALRVAKPGAHFVAFGGTRTHHRLTCAIEDAGWEIRDCLMWLYGSGFPKSLDVSKAIDKAAGECRPRVRGGQGGTNTILGARKPGEAISGEAISGEAIAWAGWGTALKPAYEPIILARKPLAGTVAANVLAHGTGALNVDGCRIDSGPSPAADRRAFSSPGLPGQQGYTITNRISPERYAEARPGEALGRWPANVCLDEAAARLVDEASGERPGMQINSVHRRGATTGKGLGYGSSSPSTPAEAVGYSDTRGASRFFYTAKASSSERHAAGRNLHPTVKPVDLMRWLCRLVTPPGGLVFDPFCGSGSTGIAALAEGFRFIGIEIDAEYARTARRRVAGPLFAEVAP